MVKGLQAKWGTCSRAVPVDDFLLALTCWKDLVAAGCCAGNIIILDAVTGTCKFALSGHKVSVTSLAFSLDGIFLVSGGSDYIVNLWDIQTGGVVKTFYGHTHIVISVSISLDHNMVASGSYEDGIRLWNTQTAECCHTLNTPGKAQFVSFSPINPQLLISLSEDKYLRWDTNGHLVGPTYSGSYICSSLDGTRLVSWITNGEIAMVQDPDSGVVVAKLRFEKPVMDRSDHWHISPDGKHVVCVVTHTIYVWDITGSDPYPSKVLVGHTSHIYSLTVSSSHVISSSEGLIKFWQIGTSPRDLVTTDPEFTPLSSPSISSINLQTKDGIAIAVDTDGVIRTWDILTGFCKASFHTNAEPQSQKYVQMIGGKLILVWCTYKNINIWTTGKAQTVRMMDTGFRFSTTNLRISGDGSKIFLLDSEHIQAICIGTGEVVGEVRLEGQLSNDPLIVDGSIVWVCFEDSPTRGWDFGVTDLTPIQLSSTPPVPDRTHLDFICGTKKQKGDSCKIEDTTTGEAVCRFPRRYWSQLQYSGMDII